MDALLMCGGRGTRLDADREKPLFRVGDRPMIDRVLDALTESRLGTVHAVASPHVPETAAHLSERAGGSGSTLRPLEAPGEGYVADLGWALDRVDRPVLTVAADLPLLAGDAVDRVLDEYAGAETGVRGPRESLTVCVPAALKRLLGVGADAAFERAGREVVPAGINVVAGGDDRIALAYDVRLAVNVNRRADARIAERLL